MKLKSFLSLSVLFLLSFSTVNASSVCDISNMTVDVQPCDTADMFMAHIAFDVTDPGSMGFLIQGNGTVYDTFDYGQTFYAIGPLAGDCTTLYEFEIVDIENDSCSATTELNVPVCCAKECVLEIDDLIVMDCDSLGQREIVFTINAENEGSLGFDLYFLGVVVEHYNYGQATYSFTIPGYNLGFGFSIADTEFPDCGSRFSFNALPCPGAIPCEINNFNINRDFVCTSDTTYNVVITVDYRGADDSLYVSLDGEPAELIGFKDFPITYFNLPVDNILHEFYVQEQDNPYCFAGTEWNDPPDCANFFQCQISNVTATVQPCQDTAALVFVDIAFIVINPESDSFLVRGNGVVYDTFAYGQTGYTVGPIQANCVDTYEFIVIDLEDPDCRGETVLAEAPCCACEISNIAVDPGNCTGDGTYELVLDFDFQNEPSDMFNVYSGNDLIGTFAYSNLPVTISDFPERDAAFDIITVCDFDDPGCCATLEFQGPDCREDVCEIFNVFAEASACNDDGELFITIEFDYDNPGNTGFMIVGNGVNYGTFQYGLADYVLGPITPDCNQVYEFAVIDIQNPDCTDFFVFNDPLCCEEGECDIYNINVDPVTCTGDGIYSLFVNFDVDNPGGNSFQVYSQGQLIGTFAYSSLPAFVPNFPERDAPFDIITICDTNNPDCCETIEFMGLDCMEEQDPCAITNLSVDPINCTGDGVYSLWVEFDVQNPTNNFFDVYSGNMLVGTFPLTDVPLIIDNFPERDAPNDLIRVCVNDNEMCCATLEFQGLDCEFIDTCAITNINVDPVECTGDGIYSTFVNFDFEGVTQDSFEVYGAGIYLGNYAFADLPVFIEDFPEREAELDIILICPVGNDACCAALEFQGLDCMEEEGDCLISNISVNPLECTGDGQYSLVLDFDFENVSNALFDVLAENDIIGTFAYADLPVTITNFPESEAGFDFLVICDNDNPACCSGFEFEGLNCREADQCDINEVFAEAADCNAEDEIYVDIEFNVTNPGSQGFVVQGNGITYDTFAYGESFYTVGPVPSDCNTIAEFVIIDIENPDCSGSFVFDQALCCDVEEPCSIFDVVAELYPCPDSSNLVFVDIDFEVVNPAAARFSIRGNGVVYDTFEYGQDFYTIGPIEADCQTQYEFIITDLENPDCSASFTFDEAPCCEDDLPCQITEIDILDAELINGVYIIVLDVEAEATGELGFDILINDEAFGFELYADLPVIIEVAQENYEAPFNITICDNDMPDCCQTILFEFMGTATLELLDDRLFDIRQSTGQLMIRTQLNTDMQVSIIAMDGRKVDDRNFNKEVFMDVSDHPAGLYVLFIESAEGVLTKKLFLSR